MQSLQNTVNNLIKTSNLPSDIDNDSKLSREDLKKVLSMITDNTLKEEEKSEIIDKVRQETLKFVNEKYNEI